MRHLFLAPMCATLAGSFSCLEALLAFCLQFNFELKFFFELLVLCKAGGRYEASSLSSSKHCLDALPDSQYSELRIHL